MGTNALVSYEKPTKLAGIGAPLGATPSATENDTCADALAARPNSSSSSSSSTARIAAAAAARAAAYVRMVLAGAT